MKREENWKENYLALKAYIMGHRQLPDKKKEENRGLLNWWKYNKKLIQAGKLPAEKVKMLDELSGMRETFVKRWTAPEND
ncbi:MAG: helicase associated domain-containing protein [Bacteroidales bacterium]|nr:helicase associated domain-containing protein [Bacteroidales bacterium]